MGSAAGGSSRQRRPVADNLNMSRSPIKPVLAFGSGDGDLGSLLAYYITRFRPRREIEWDA